MSEAPEQPRVEVLLVAHDGVLRRGLEMVLTAHDVHVNACTADAAETVKAAGSHPSHLVLLDLALNEEAQRVVEAIAEAAPRLPLLGYGDRHPWPIHRLLDAGMRGFVLSTSKPGPFMRAVRTVASGAAYLDPDFALSRERENGLVLRVPLTDRERQIVGLLAHGLTGREIATRLFLSPATVRTHIQNAMHKLDARTRAQAIALFTGGAMENESESENGGATAA